MTKHLTLIALAALAAVSCNSAKLSEEHVEYSYEESFENINNPERGFYKPFDFRKADKTISADDVKACVESNYTLLLYEFYLTDFMESDISEAYLQNIANSFQALRDGGAKCILRFAYKSRESDKPWDASEEWVLRHIEQLAPVIQENSDVILCWQAGFVGVWGEFYYTDNFVFQPKTDEDYQPRKHVLDAMLKVLPENRQVAVRTPTFKLRMYGIGFKDYLTTSTAHSGSTLSRIGAFNDCFVASPDDVETYDSDAHREFWSKDNRYVIMGGETCRVYEPNCKCDFSIAELERFHWTYLNSAYNRHVLQVWKDGECFDEVELRLGYRFVLENAYIPQKAARKSNLTLGLVLRNDGFAAPQNPRGFELVFVNRKGRKTVCPLENDPRYFLDGERYVFEINVPTPAKAGTYKVYLNFPDPEPKLYGNPAYSIRLANKDIWDAETGYNYLADIVIK